jgi:single-strand DNA-binding protein
LKKGNKVAVSGSIQTRNYEKADGTKGFSVDIVADEVEFLSSKNDGTPEGSEGGMGFGGGNSVSELQPIDDDNLPF